MPVPPVDLPVASLAPYAPAARREATVFGAPVEIVLLPGRAERAGRAESSRPAFAPSPAPRILRDEALWRGGGIVATPNRWPFARAQALLWSEAAAREADPALLEAAFAWADAARGAALVNGIGAAASIARAHVHLTPERLPFLGALRERPAHDPFLPGVAGATYAWKDVPFCALGVRGAPRPRAEAVHALGLLRLTAAWSVVAQDGAAWLFPRAVETPAPHFPEALGAAELWGRWCHCRRDAFERETGPMLEEALRAACAPPLGEPLP